MAIPNVASMAAADERSPTMSNQKPAEKKYKVGYQLPPKSGQFKRGQSGNPQGRPKGVANFSTDVKKVMRLPVALTENGKIKKISSQKASLMRLRHMALDGQLKPLVKFLDLGDRHNNHAEDQPADEISPADEAIVEGYRQRMREAIVGKQKRAASEKTFSQTKPKNKTKSKGV